MSHTHKQEQSANGQRTFTPWYLSPTIYLENICYKKVHCNNIQEIYDSSHGGGCSQICGNKMKCSANIWHVNECNIWPIYATSNEFNI